MCFSQKIILNTLVIKTNPLNQPNSIFTCFLLKKLNKINDSKLTKPPKKSLVLLTYKNKCYMFKKENSRRCECNLL